ncbi:MAG TPA: HemK family protein methyltransferase, partial [Thermoanaerobaculia bacterium]
RRETELVARAAAQLAQRIAAQKGAVRVMDVCTGSANVALAIAIAEPRATVFASDLSEEAVELARLNVAHAGLENRVTLRSGDLLAPFDEPEFVGTIDLLTCNPPYISSGRVDQLPAEIGGHEPRLAFDGGPLGVRILQRLIREAPRMLVPGGWLAFEVGLGQGKSVAQRMRSSGAYASVEPVEDERGETRVLIARAT